MKLPPAYLFSCLLLWGWQHQQWPLALLIGSFLELARAGFLASREASTPDSMRRGVGWCGGLSTLASVLALLSGQGGGLAQGLLTLLSWLPVVLLPWLVWQYRDAPQGLPAHWWGGKPGEWVRIDLLYALVCWLAASLGNRQPVGFALVVLLLISGLLWFHRPRRGQSLVFWLMLGLAGTGGMLLNGTLVQGQLLMEQHLLVWLSHWWESPLRDPTRQATALGRLGRLKQSSRIVIRLDQQQRRPVLLFQASYNVLADTTWFARQGNFVRLPQGHSLSWSLPMLSTEVEHQATLGIVQTVAGSSDLLALPAGGMRIMDIAAEQLRINQYGAVQALGIPSPVSYQVGIGGEHFSGAPPTDDDLRVPPALVPVLQTVVTEAGLAAVAPTQLPTALERFFSSHFRYSLDLQGQDIAAFLSSRREGHCEYFATASVLLLRQLGVPARYATGYSVQEYSPLEGRMVARQRHAHAWALAYLQGHWQVVDTTPPDWFHEEAQLAPWWAGLHDLWSFLAWQIYQWQGLQLQPGLAIPIVGLLLFSWGGLRWRRRVTQTREALPVVAGSGMDSECYRIVDWCLQQGLERPVGQTLAHWLPQAVGTLSHDPELHEILRLHYRYRFDPRGLSPPQRERLRHLVHHWLSRHPPS